MSSGPFFAPFVLDCARAQSPSEHETAQRRQNRRRFAQGLVAAPLAFAASTYGADTFPVKPVRLVVPAAAGGSADILARLLSERLSRVWSHPVIVDNRPGAALMVGTDAVAKAAPDGHTLLLTPDGPITINPNLYPKMPYDPAKDLVPVARAATVPLVLVVHPSVPAKNVQELISLAKREPGKLNYGAGGSTTRIAAELFRLMTATEMVHVPYRGSGPMVSALLANQVQLAFDGIPSSMANVKAGKLRALAVTSSTRLAALPDIPTLEEAGVAGYEAGTWIGLFAPAGTPGETLARINTDVGSVLAQPDLRNRLNELGMPVDVASGSNFAAQVRADTAKWAEVIRRANITAD